MAVTTKKDASRVLSDAADDKLFCCRDGCILHNLIELAGCLEHMSADVFAHHVSSSNNDFSNWIRDVFRDDELAAALSKATDSDACAKLVRERIKWLKRKCA